MGIRAILYVLFFAFIGQGLMAQDIIVGLFPAEEEVMVRWYPMNYEVWQSGIENGYSIKRTTIADPSGKMLVEPTESTVLISAVFPMDSLTWVNQIDTSMKHDVMAAATIYGEMHSNYQVSESRAERILNYENPSIQKHTFHLVSVSQSFTTAERAGLAYRDPSAEEGYVYRYEVSLVKGSYKSDAVISYSPITSVTSVKEIRKNISGKSVVLSWDHAIYTDIYSSYDIYRSVATSEKEKINTSPLMPTLVGTDVYAVSYADTISEGYDEASYYIKGIHLYDQRTEYSLPVKVQAEKEKFPMISITAIEQVDADRIEIDYQVQDVSSMDLYYAERYTGAYRKIDSVSDINQFSFSLGDLRSGYLYFADVDSNHKSNKVYLTVEDIIPPDMPIGLSCYIDSIDYNLVLDWDDNIDEDIYGYRAFASWDREQGFLDIGQGVFPDSEYRYEIDGRQNGETFYVSVAALDFNLNQSKYTQPCSVTMMDVKPPSPPLIRRISFDEGAVRFQWARSPDREATLHKIERVHVDSSDWQVIHETGTTYQVEEYVDDQVQSSSKYYYRVKAMDQAGNFSYSPLVVGRTTEVEKPKEIENLQGKIEEGKLILSWEFDGNGIDHWLVYGSDKDEWSLMKKIKMKETMAGDSFKFRYSFNENFNNKAFKIQGVGSDRSRTKMSERVVVIR